MQFRAAEVALLVGGRLLGPDVDVVGARHDSREVRGGELFVPVRGERDGHEFVGAALARGAAAYFTAREPVGGTAVAVDDPERALTRWGAAARQRLPDRVVGITGSVGKTSTKDLLAAALAGSYRTHASPRSFNNELGVPLTLVNAPDGTEATVVEMGARGAGHIASLCEIARPTIAVVTTVDRVHTELFGSIDEVALAKGELVEAVPASGAAVLNAANPYVLAMAERTSARVLTFGTDDADVWADAIRVDGRLRPSFTLHTPWGSAPVRLEVRGEQHVGNALAAAGAALVAGASFESVVDGLAVATLSPWRMQLVEAPSGALVVNDAYNAGPASVAAALRSLAQLTADRRIAVLGVMAELGVDSDQLHREVADLARSLDVEVLAVDAPAYDGDGVHHVASADAALVRLGDLDLGTGDAVLVKGSRVAGLERLAAALTAPSS